MRSCLSLRVFTPDGVFYEIKIECLAGSLNYTGTMTWLAEEFKIDKHDCVVGVAPSIVDGKRSSRFIIEVAGNQLHIMDGHVDWSFSGESIVLNGFVESLRALAK